MKLHICSNCHQHFIGNTCEHCDGIQRTKLPKIAGLALVLGLGLSACGDKDDDTADNEDTEETEETEEPAAEPETAALYGVEEME